MLTMSKEDNILIHIVQLFLMDYINKICLEGNYIYYINKEVV
jgi:hypothetical protein